MSKFITGKELETAVDEIIWKAKDELIIVSPFIKLDNHFKELFDKQRHIHELHILLMFGKNEGRVNKSFNKEDLEYFKQFPNISIVYVPQLHAKYYANEKKGVVTSINLYDYSFRNNIEFGVLFDNKFLNKLSLNTDNEVWNTCKDLANAHNVIYINRPMYDKDDYRGSKTLWDMTEELYSGKVISKAPKTFEDFEDGLDYEKVFSRMPSRSNKPEQPVRRVHAEPIQTPNKSFEPGYCIRTGVKIPFNPKSPMSYQAYQSWSKYSNTEFAEKYCHFSGEPSNGETSVKRPILYKNWKKANQT